MPRFKVHGLSDQSQLLLLRVSAASRADAMRIAEQTGMRVLDVQGAAWQSLASGPGRMRFDLTLFTHELVALLGAGLSLIETLETLDERQQDLGQTGSVISELVRSMRQGLSFSAALRQFPAVFPEIFIASVAASEHTGEMVPALKRYLRYNEQVGLIRQRIISASIYPAMLCVVGLGVALFLLCFLVPRFSRVYEGMEDKLPPTSRWLMQWGGFASQHWPAITLVLVVILATVAALLSRPAVRHALLATVQQGRWVGVKVRLMQLSRFYRSLGLLLGGGIALPKALGMAQNLLPAHLQVAATLAGTMVSQGMRLSDSLHRAALTTPVALRLLRAGERDGQMAEMLEQAASFHDKEMAQWIDRFTRMFEPVLMLVIGLAIGGIVIMLYLPIFELAGSAQ